jgi:flagellar basal-body rod protein FlgC
MYGALDISTSALVAQRVRLETVSANLANRMSITRSPDGGYEAYRRRIPILSPGDPAGGAELGVHVAEILEDSAPPLIKYEPGSPFADSKGYVEYPNISPEMEMMNAMEALRSYEANIAAAETTKTMINSALQMLA